MSYPWKVCVSLRGRAGVGEWSYLDGLSPENKEGLGTLCQEASKLVDQNMLNFIGLLDLDADPYAVDAGFDEDALIFVAGNRQWGQ